MGEKVLSPEEVLKLFENGPTILFVWKAAEQWPVELVSANVTQLGYRPEDFMSGRLPYAAIIHPEDLPRIAREVREYSDSGALCFEQDYRILDPHGGVRWLYDFTVVRRDDEGNVTHYYGYVQDVTARRLAQQAAEESGRRYRAVVDAFNGWIYIVTADYQLSLVNRRLADRLGRQPVGEACYKAIYDRDSICPWCTNDRVFSGQTVEWEFHNPKDDRWYHVVDTPVGTVGGRPAKLSLVQDITDHKLADQLVRRRESILEVLGDAAGKFLECRKMEHCIDTVLARLGQALNVNWVHLTEIEELPGNEVVAHRRFEWAAPGVPSRLYHHAAREIALRKQGLSRWIEQLSHRRIVWGDTCDFPEGERAFLSQLGISSLALLPFFAGEKWRGYLGFEMQRQSRAWSVVELDALKTLCGLIGAALQREESEESLRRSNEEKATLLNAIPDAMIRFNRRGTVLDLKPIRELKLPPTRECVGRPLDAIFPKAVAEELMRYAQAAWRESSRQVFEISLGEESPRVAEARMLALSAEDVLVILRDITARKRADEAIAKLAAFPLNNPNPLVELDEQGRPIFANPAAHNAAVEAGLGETVALLPADAGELCQTCLASGQIALRVTDRPNGEQIAWYFVPLVDRRTVHAYGYRVPKGYKLVENT